MTASMLKLYTKYEMSATPVFITKMMRIMEYSGRFL